MSRKIRTIIDGNAFYEIDEECYEKLQRRKEAAEQKEANREPKHHGQREDESRRKYGKSGA